MIDANTYYLNQYMAEQDALQALDDWREDRAAEIKEEILAGDHELFWDLGGETYEAIEEVRENDDQQDLIQLIIYASQSGDAKMESCARRYFAVIEKAVDKMADAKAADMVPEADDEY